MASPPRRVRFLFKHMNKVADRAPNTNAAPMPTPIPTPRVVFFVELAGGVDGVMDGDMVAGGVIEILADTDVGLEDVAGDPETDDVVGSTTAEGKLVENGGGETVELEDEVAELLYTI